MFLLTVFLGFLTQIKWENWQYNTGYRLGPFFLRTALHCQFSITDLNSPWTLISSEFTWYINLGRSHSVSWINVFEVIPIHSRITAWIQIRLLWTADSGSRSPRMRSRWPNSGSLTRSLTPSHSHLSLTWFFASWPVHKNEKKRCLEEVVRKCLENKPGAPITHRTRDLWIWSGLESVVQLTDVCDERFMICVFWGFGFFRLTYLGNTRK